MEKELEKQLQMEKELEKQLQKEKQLEKQLQKEKQLLLLGQLFLLNQVLCIRNQKYCRIFGLWKFKLFFNPFFNPFAPRGHYWLCTRKWRAPKIKKPKRSKYFFFMSIFLLLITICKNTLFFFHQWNLMLMFNEQCQITEIEIILKGLKSKMHLVRSWLIQVCCFF